MEAGGCVSGEEDRTNDDNIVSPKDSCIEVECKQGDIIFLNTRLWWHSTLIPPQDVPSISYARDIYFTNAGPRRDTPRDADGTESVEDDEEGNDGEGGTGQEETAMTNVDGTYATEDIAAETILFTERNMPECELHRSSDPNCRVVELEDDGGLGGSYMAVVTLRDITAGEFFSVLESDEEDGSDSGEEDGDWDEEEEEEEDRCIIAPK
jgi:U3 small nucleolar RNA-associated protein 6